MPRPVPFDPTILPRVLMGKTGAGQINVTPIVAAAAPASPEVGLKNF
jgi:hypothetical protein